MRTRNIYIVMLDTVLRFYVCMGTIGETSGERGVTGDLYDSKSVI